MKDKNYWLQRGKEGPKKDGFVCVGRGTSEGLLLSLGIDKYELYSTEGHAQGPLENCWNGKSDDFFYLKIEKFNSLFPEPEKTKQEKIAEFQAEIDKLKREIEAEQLGFGVGDLLYSKNEKYGWEYLVRVSKIRKGVIEEDYLCLGDSDSVAGGEFYSEENTFTKITL